MISLRSINVVANGKISSFYGRVVFHCMCIYIYPTSFHPLMGTRLFPILAIVNNAGMNIGVHVSVFRLVFSYSLDKYPEVG